MNTLIVLPGRKESSVQLDEAIDDAHLTGRRLLVALVDLDRFYRLNETRGMKFGNDVLELIGSRIQAAAMPFLEATVCSADHLNGNTFLVVIAMEQETAQYWQAVEAIKYAVERPIASDGQELYLTTSIGVSLFPQDGSTGEQLMCCAESSLYRSKEQGGNRISFYNKGDTQRQKRYMRIESELRRALIMGQFQMSYQPMYRLKDGRLRGYEALLRWHHPELGTITPTEFIPIAEYNGLIVPIGEWVLREACKKLLYMNQYGTKELMMSVNISPVQLQDSAFTSRLLHVLEEYGLRPAAIELEIKESVMIHSSQQSIAALSNLRAAGVRIALDDFGIGYSSYQNLQKLPIHCLKIDKSFIGKIDVGGAERYIVESIIQLVHKLGLEAVAVGVEFEEQYRLLREWGCHYAQGYLLSQPMDPTMIDEDMFRGIKAT